MSRLAMAGGFAASKHRHGRLRLRTLLLIRWIAVVGQGGTLAFVHFILGYRFDLAWPALTVGALAALTLSMQLSRKASTRLDDRQSALNFAFDLVQLSALLFLTGGLHNPFATLILAPVTVSAAALSHRSTLGLAALALLCILFLSAFHRPLPWPESGFAPPPLFVLALALALGLAVIFITSYVFRVAEEARRIANALMAAEAALERERRLSSVGALAAAAAHELGTPLGTIALVTQELRRDLPPASPLRADLDLLARESDRCREILAEIARRPGLDAADHFHEVPAPLLVELAAAPFRRPSVALRIETRPDPAEPAPPLLPRRPELLRGLGNLLQNAIEFAREEVLVEIAWSRQEIVIRILDDGPGFAGEMLHRLGDPYLERATPLAPARREGDHMGLGIFIAQNLIERIGGGITVRNGAFAGAEIEIRWPRGNSASR